MGLIHILFIVDNHYLHGIIDRVLTIVSRLTSCLRFFKRPRCGEAPPPVHILTALVASQLLFVFFAGEFLINYLNTTNIYIRFTKLIDLSTGVGIVSTS